MICGIATAARPMKVRYTMRRSYTDGAGPLYRFALPAILCRCWTAFVCWRRYWEYSDCRIFATTACIPDRSCTWTCVASKVIQTSAAAFSTSFVKSAVAHILAPFASVESPPALRWPKKTCDELDLTCRFATRVTWWSWRARICAFCRDLFDVAVIFSTPQTHQSSAVLPCLNE